MPTSRSDWLCRGCRAILGEVEDARLRVAVKDVTLLPHGGAEVTCPACKQIREWKPYGANRRGAA